MNKILFWVFWVETIQTKDYTIITFNNIVLLDTANGCYWYNINTTNITCFLSSQSKYIHHLKIINLHNQGNYTTFFPLFNTLHRFIIIQIKSSSSNLV